MSEAGDYCDDYDRMSEGERKSGRRWILPLPVAEAFGFAVFGPAGGIYLDAVASTACGAIGRYLFWGGYSHDGVLATWSGEIASGLTVQRIRIVPGGRPFGFPESEFDRHGPGLMASVRMTSDPRGRGAGSYAVFQGPYVFPDAVGRNSYDAINGMLRNGPVRVQAGDGRPTEAKTWAALKALGFSAVPVHVRRTGPWRRPPGGPPRVRSEAGPGRGDGVTFLSRLPGPPGP